MCNIILGLRSNSSYFSGISEEDSYICMCIKSLPRGAPTEQPEATVAKRCGLFNQKKYGSMKTDKFSLVERQALAAGDAVKVDTIRFFRNSNEIYRRFGDWKDIDKFYFIPLKLEMTYGITGHSICMAGGPLHLGTFIKNTLQHPDLFTAPCPQCSLQLLPYGYNGSPLSGRVDLEATCPECGWNSYVAVTGWRIRSEALKASQKVDRLRHLKARLLKPGFKASTVEELLKYLND